MNFKFQWVQKPDPNQTESLQTEISDILARLFEQEDINPCHPGRPRVFLGIIGPLDDKLHGSAQCRCGKTLMSFKGDSSASNLEHTKY